MPIHDGQRVPAGLFHHFHQDWSVELARALNRGLLPGGYAALVEQRLEGPEPNVVAIESPVRDASDSGGLLVRSRPHTRRTQSVLTEELAHARKANRITIRHRLGDVVAVIEIVSPGNNKIFAACAAEVCGENTGVAGAGCASAGGRSVSADATRPARHSCSDLQRTDRRSVRASVRDAIDARVVSVGAGDYRTCRERGRGPAAARHAAVPDERRLRARAAGTHVHGRVGSLSGGNSRFALIARTAATIAHRW